MALKQILIFAAIILKAISDTEIGEDCGFTEKYKITSLKIAYSNPSESYPTIGGKAILTFDAYFSQVVLMTGLSSIIHYYNEVIFNSTERMSTFMVGNQIISTSYEFGNKTGEYSATFHIKSSGAIACWRFRYNID